MPCSLLPLTDSFHPSTRDIYLPAESDCVSEFRAAEQWLRLPHLDQMAIRVSDVRADLADMVLWLGEKLRASGRPFFVCLLNVRHSDVHEGAGAVRVGRGGQGHGRLVIRRPAADVQDDPGVGDLHDHRIALDEHLAIEDLFVELAGTILVRDDQEVGDDEALLGRGKVIWVHVRPPFALLKTSGTPPALPKRL